MPIGVKIVESVACTFLVCFSLWRSPVCTARCWSIFLCGDIFLNIKSTGLVVLLQVISSFFMPVCLFVGLLCFGYTHVYLRSSMYIWVCNCI